MAFVISSPALPSADVVGSEHRFPVGRIFCVGRNYAAHAREMGGKEREAPFFFMKFAQALVAGGGTIPYPPATTSFHHEVELVIAIGREAAAIAAADALDVVFGYGVGLDMTRRDLQSAAKDKGRPWDTAKNFAYSAPLSALTPVETCGHPTSGAITLAVNGVTKQTGDLADMIWSCAEVVSHLSHLERLLPGDLIYTGTPAGVGPVQPGDQIEATVAGLVPLRVTIGDREPEFAK
ncbi:MAG: nagK [Labilithrix sp.]|nr:nagK [Labilithrix sp.]